MKIFKISYRINKRKFNFFTLSIIFFVLFTTLLLILPCTQTDYNSFNDENPKNSALWATLDLTNPAEINNTRFTHNSPITIKGRLYKATPPISGKSGYTVAMEIDDVLDTRYTNITDTNGYFQISYIIDPSLDVYSSHILNVSVIDSTPGEVEYHHFYIINVNTTSYFDIDSYENPSIPKLTEEFFDVNGYLRDANDSPILNRDVNYYWLDGTTIISQGIFSTGVSGSLQAVQVPSTSLSHLNLKFDFSYPPFIDYSEIESPPISIFSDVSWDLDYDDTTYVGTQYTIQGELSSITDSSLKISNRNVDVFYDDQYKGTTSTDVNGRFSYTFGITGDNGSKSFRLELVNSAGGFINVERWISVDLPISSPGTQNEFPPFLIFSLIFFPILAVIVAGLAIYGYRYYKKQEEESRVINVPLVSKIKNLKLLKESGRIEEALSYLFNAIYMDLVHAKYGRSRKINETIRDFAIISVKDLKLTPAAIYPFIQKIEEIIYGKPFKVTEDDFYKSCELFSPIYYQLTGYNFVLNF
jgi:hypothetical protein